MQDQVSTGRHLQHQSLTTKDKARVQAAPLTVARRILEPNSYHRAEASLLRIFLWDMQLSIILKGSKQLLLHPNTVRYLQPRASPSNVLLHCQAQAKLYLDLQAGVQPVLQGWYTSSGWHNPPARTCCTATNRLENIQHMILLPAERREGRGNGSAGAESTSNAVFML